MCTTGTIAVARFAITVTSLRRLEATDVPTPSNPPIRLSATACGITALSTMLLSRGIGLDTGLIGLGVL